MDEACSTDVQKINAHNILVGKPEVKTLLAELRCRLADNAETEDGCLLGSSTV
jgi:hypothetical protein